jgi:hypothetical protein
VGLLVGVRAQLAQQPVAPFAAAAERDTR